MKKEAVKAGYYNSPAGEVSKDSDPHNQTLLDGTERALYPDLMQGGLMFKRANYGNQRTSDATS